MSEPVIEPISIEQPLTSSQNQIIYPNFLDRLALFLLEDKDGKPRGFAVQTLLEFIGLPTIFSAADAVGALRGYLNLRQGHRFKGYLQFITAIMPGIPTGPVHFVIEYILPDKPGMKPNL